MNQGNGARRLKQQSGQAMIFGVLFMAVVVMAMLILYNQGQLIKNRVQLENTADAVAYSQAKLAARNMNFAAYTNRAMIANEVSIGQMVSLLSWAKHYKNVGAFVKYPAYQFPVLPPAPVTFSNVLEVALLPYTVLGTAVEAPSKVMTDVWPKGINALNMVLYTAQNIFSLSTIAAQVEANLEVVEGHEFDPAQRELYTPFIGWYFMLQNTMLTYFGEDSGIDPGSLSDAVSLVDTSGVDGDDLVADFLGGQTEDVHSLINRNSPAGGAGDSAVDAYKRYAAIVNGNREDFTRDRHWDLGYGFGFDPTISLDFGVVKITFDIDFSFWFGLRNDGGSVFEANGPLEDNNDIKKLGWSAIDVLSIGLEAELSIDITIRICLPIVGCSSWTIPIHPPALSLGFPLAGATHQAVQDIADAKKILTDWGSIGDADGKYGGDPGSDVNDGPLDMFHAQALAWGQIAPQLQPGGMYGARTFTDVSTSYRGPPGFLSLGENFRESRVGYEFTSAIAKSLDDVETTDNEDSFNIGDDGSYDPDDWDDTGEDIGLTRLEVDTYSRAEANDVAGAYQQVVWGDQKPMMTISAAEVYFRNPMQIADSGAEEAASLFSPFWDARLKEPSAISLLLATGDIDWDEVLSGVPDDAVGLVNWMMTRMMEDLVDTSVDYVKGQLPSPVDSLLDGPLDDVGDAAKGVGGDVVDNVTDELAEFID